MCTLTLFNRLNTFRKKDKEPKSMFSVFFFYIINTYKQLLCLVYYITYIYNFFFIMNTDFDLLLIYLLITYIS